MLYKIVFLALLITPCWGLAQVEKGDQKNGLRVEYGTAAFRVDNASGTYFGGVWSHQLTSRVDLEIVINHFDFSEGDGSIVLSNTYG